MDDLERILELSPAQKKQFFDELGFYTYALCEIDDDNKRIPFYIGKGKNTRCLSHLSEKRDNEKTQRIKNLAQSKRLGIDILAYGLEEKGSVSGRVCLHRLIEYKKT